MNAEHVPTPIAHAMRLSNVQSLDSMSSSPRQRRTSSTLRSSFRRSGGGGNGNNSDRYSNDNNKMRRHFESTPSLLTTLSSSGGSSLTSMRRTPSTISLEKHDMFVFERLNAMVLDEEDKQGGENRGGEEGMARCQSLPAMSMSVSANRRNWQQVQTERAHERARQISEDGKMANREICRRDVSDNDEDLSIDDGYFPGYDTADESDSEEEDEFGNNIRDCQSSLSLNSGGRGKGALPLMARIHDEVIDDHVKKGRLIRTSSTPSIGSSPSTGSMRRNNVSFVAIPEDREHDDDDIDQEKDEWCHYGNENDEELLCEPQLGRQRSDSAWSIMEGYEEDEDDEHDTTAIGEEDSPFSLFGSLPPIQIRTRETEKNRTDA